MAPVLSKMPSSGDAQSPGRHLSLVLSTQSSLSTLNQLTDDSLLILLSLIPLDSLLSTVQLTCKRWHSLLPVILRRRHYLSISLDYYPNRFTSQFFLFLSKKCILPDTFQVHLNKPLKPTQEQQSSTCSLTTGKLGIFVFDVFHPSLHSFHLNVATHFPNLRHLSLIGLILPLEHLLHLLATYRDRLVSLALKHLIIHGRTLEDESPSDQDDLNGSLLAVLDTMPVLRRLALGIAGQGLNLGTALGTLLPRLTFLSLDVEKTVDLYQTLRKISGGQLRELKLFNLEGSQMFTLALLFSSKPSFARSLTSLTLKYKQGNDFFKEGVTVQFLEAIVAHCTRLQHLDLSIEISTQFNSLLPHLAKLTRLTSLGLTSRNEEFFKASPGALQSGPSPPLIALRILTLKICLSLEMSSVLPFVCPNLLKLYLVR